MYSGNCSSSGIYSIDVRFSKMLEISFISVTSYSGYINEITDLPTVFIKELRLYQDAIFFYHGNFQFSTVNQVWKIRLTLLERGVKIHYVFSLF